MARVAQLAGKGAATGYTELSPLGVPASCDRGIGYPILHVSQCITQIVRKAVFLISN